jgi:glycosyltransferase involved in cell wall biosynthesis
LVLRAFFAIRKKYAHARLLLKDERNLYKLSGVAVVQETLRNFPQTDAEELLASIKLISVTLPVYEMRHLYCMADVYVSPYRAEGFNLPVIESIACGTPVVVTAGGATDDYCNPQVASAVPSTQVPNSSRNLPGTGYTLEPDLYALIAAMEQHIENPVSASDAFAAGRQQVCEGFSWSRCTERLTTFF